MNCTESNLSPTPLPVIVADDDPMARRLLQLHLRRWGVDCVLVADGTELIEAMKTGKYGAAIVDGAMPLMDGIEAVRAIREGKAGEHHRRILLVAHSGQGEFRIPFRDAGADWFIDKPLQADALRQALALAHLLPPPPARALGPMFLRTHALSARSTAAFA